MLEILYKIIYTLQMDYMLNSNLQKCDNFQRSHMSIKVSYIAFIDYDKIFCWLIDWSSKIAKYHLEAKKYTLIHYKCKIPTKSLVHDWLLCLTYNSLIKNSTSLQFHRISHSCP